MCYWTDKYPEGSDHWLLGGIERVDVGNNSAPVCFVNSGWRLAAELEALEPDAIPLDVLIREVGPDKVMAALEEYLGVPKATPSVHWSTLKVGDKVKLVATGDEDGDEFIETTVGPYIVVGLEPASYTGRMPLRIKCDTTGEYSWPHIDGIVGVHN